MEKHSGFRDNYRGRSEKEIQKAIHSFRKRIKEHEECIAEPEKHYPGFGQLDERRKENLKTTKWNKDIDRLKEQLEILEGILAVENKRQE